MLIGEAPGQNEVKFGRPFIGPSGFKLEELLRRAGTSRVHVTITNAILCRPEVPDLTGRRRYEVKEYIAWLRRENVKIRKNKGVEMMNPFDACRPRLDAEIKAGEAFALEARQPNGLVVMPMGNFALSQLMGARKRATGIMKYRGSVIRVNPDGTIPT